MKMQCWKIKMFHQAVNTVLTLPCHVLPFWLVWGSYKKPAAAACFQRALNMKKKGSRQRSKAGMLPGFSLYFNPLAYKFSRQTGSAIQMFPPQLLDKESETHDTYTCKRELCMLQSYCQIQNTMKEQRNALNSVMHAFGRRVMLLAVRLSPEMEIHNSVCGSVSFIKTLSLFLLSKYI